MEQYGTSLGALSRHAADHIPASLSTAREARQVAQADTLLGQVQALRERALGLLERAERGDDIRSAVAAIREVRSCVELMAKVAGELREGPTVNVLVSPDWLRLREAIMTALADHPAARQSVAAALLEHRP